MDLRLEYKRDEGETFTGKLYVGETIFAYQSFERVDHPTMMAAVAGALKLYPELDVGVVVQRTDRLGIPPVRLEAELVRQLRDDTAGAIKALSPERRVVIIRDKAAPKGTAEVVLYAGEDTLAESFGDDVYLRIRDGRIEDPITGRWVACTLRGEMAFVGQLPIKKLFKWVVISTETLLGAPVERFFLPRKWNVGGPWISKEVLQQRYQAYKEEKANVHT